MKYFIIIMLFAGFSIISFGAEETRSAEEQKLISSGVELYLIHSGRDGSISSLKKIYEQTGHVFLEGVSTAVRHRMRILKPVGKPMTLLIASQLDYLSSPQAEKDESQIREEIINTIKGQSPGGGKGGGSASPPGAGNPPKKGSGGFILGQSRLDVDRLGPDDSVNRGTENTESARAQVVDAEYEEFLRVYNEALIEKAKAGDISAMEELYESYREAGQAEKADIWLNELKSVANTGDVSVLKVVYRLTGEVLVSGLQAAVGAALQLISEDSGLRPKITAMQNGERIRNNIVREITTPAPNRCIAAFANALAN